MTQNQSSVIKFTVVLIFFYHLQVSDSKTQGKASPPTFSPGGGTNAFFPTFSWHKPNIISSRSVFYFFLPLKVSDKKLEWMSGINPPNNLVAFPQ